jgi:plastocyanin
MTRRPAMLAVGAAAVLLLPGAAQAATKSVDMGTPLKFQKQLNTKYFADANDFFPHGITIHAGDSVKFVPTGFHNVDFPAKGGKPTALLKTGAPVAGAVDPAGAPYWFNGAPNVSLNPALVVGGLLGKKVTYTRAKGVQSGLPVSDKPKPMTVKFPKTGTYTYYCDVHTGMKGTVRVLADSKPIPSAKADKKTVAAQVARVIKLAKGLQKPTLPANTVTVGNAAAHGVEVYKFLPETLTVPVGTTVTFTMSPKTFEDHTATAGPGNPESDPNSFLGKMAASFESPQIDPAAAYPSDPPTAGPAALTPALHGNGFWNSGVLDVLSSTPQLPASSKVTFAAAGSYKFYCLIHPFMVGTVNVQ